MADYIWKKDSTGEVDERVMRFLAGQDVILDRELLPFDIRASQAHARGLARIGVLGEEQAEQMVSALNDLQDAFAAGEFVLDERHEDGHSAIEAWLIDRLGELGGRIHAGRSRNDQVAVAVRLYLRHRLGRLGELCREIARVALDRAESEAMVPLPGHTHLQQAMPSSLGLWWAGHAEAFIDNADLAGQVAEWLDASPLGTASGFGVNLALDREGVASELGFPRLVVNPQYAQNSRGKVELRAVDALAAATGDLRRLAWDLSLYASEEYGFMKIGSAYCTGSSIMPNKHNPDTVELLRSLHATVVGARAELDAVLSLPSGYQRDLQDTKPPLIRAFQRGLAGLELVPDLLESIAWNEARMREAIAPALHATDRANELVGQGRPFREAYRQAAEELDDLADRPPEASLEARVSPGGCANLLLDRLKERLAALKES
ncbi:MULTISPECIES: argininosuccinate lyase [unclassified Wenzhouxiangella]|uniref:argininosuccinate lyase n=1 Tax=unclassified Wenzhouxiangella TaxID=2613841 RepID=UPI000E329AEF|nr:MULTISPECIES: argininosuccinate lyase [unclassified Wenzhouxiangella]RFF26933.1 argininosuccinate lyase [Wenzhouxiangella sp. 15181]RFP69446.1 argininosuccinate lyase [Wenzhouxiangella sp. 15190]